jgi:hypothetical protein
VDSTVSVLSASPSPEPSPKANTPAAPSAPQAAKDDQKETAAASTLGMVKDCVDIIFFLVAGTVVVLTFNQAKKSIFNPVRTEAFKLQLKAFEDVLLFFEKEASTHIGDKFDLEKILFLNAMKMLDEYAVTFFGNLFKKEEFSKNREELYKEIAGELVTRDFMEKHLETPGHFQDQARNRADEVPSEPALQLAQWKLYVHGVIHYTKPYQEATERLRRFNASPLLPKELKGLISEFDVLVSENFHKVGLMLTEVAKELPVKYPAFSILGRADLSWIWNKYNHTRVSLDEKQNAILTYVEGYLQIDDLLERKDKPSKKLPT